MSYISDELEKELDTICDAMTKLHSVGEMKHIGRRELLRAFSDILKEIKRVVPARWKLKARAIEALKVIEGKAK